MQGMAGIGSWLYFTLAVWKCFGTLVQRCFRYEFFNFFGLNCHSVQCGKNGGHKATWRRIHCGRKRRIWSPSDPFSFNRYASSLRDPDLPFSSLSSMTIIASLCPNALFGTTFKVHTRSAFGSAVLLMQLQQQQLEREGSGEVDEEASSREEDNQQEQSARCHTYS